VIASQKNSEKSLTMMCKGVSEMNSLQRIQNAVTHKKTDVVPVAPYMGNHAAFVSGMKLYDYYTNGRKMFEAQARAWELYQQDVIVLQSDNYYIAEGFGTRVTYYENSTPTLSEPVITSIKDVDKLKVPDPWSDGRMPVYLEAISLASGAYGREVAIRGCGTGPFSLAGHLLGTQEFLMEIAQLNYDDSNRAAIHELMELTTEALLRFDIAQLEAGAHIVICGDSLASADMISPAMYEEFVLPYEQKLFSSLRQYTEKHGGYSLLHICGNNTKTLDLIASTGADIFEVDYKVDLRLCRQKMQGKMCLMGNINPVTLLLGSPEEVERETMKCIEAMGDCRGFILGTGCEVAVETPKENMLKMIQTARSFKIQ